jgi:hypothetical protein
MKGSALVDDCTKVIKMHGTQNIKVQERLIYSGKKGMCRKERIINTFISK